jgi:aryl-phospho-beta-D-glucosidase BglC (GH1 family)
MRAGKIAATGAAVVVFLAGAAAGFAVGVRVGSPGQAVAVQPTTTPASTTTTTSATPVATAGYTIAPALALRVSGNRLLNPAGQTVTLHGADMSGTEFVCVQNAGQDPFGGQPEDSPATFAAMKSWGISAVRIPLNEDCWLGLNGPSISGAAYRDPIIQMVRDLEQDGFYVILDLHWSAPGTALAQAQQPAPDESHTPSFWRSVASTFAGDGGVLFDLYNELNLAGNTASGVDPWTCAWQGCTITDYVAAHSKTVQTSWQSSGYDQLTSSIRSTGAANLILAGCLSWAGNCTGWTKESGDPNTVISWHAYPGSAGLANEEAYWNATIAPLSLQVPIIIGETGDNSTPPTPYLSALLPFVTQHSLGVLAWSWNAFGSSAADLVTNMQTGTPTSGEGVVYQTWLHSLP